MVVKRKRIGEILQDIGLVDEKQLTAALQEQKETRESLGTILFRMGVISSEDLCNALAE